MKVAIDPQIIAVIAVVAFGAIDQDITQPKASVAKVAIRLCDGAK